MKHPLPFCCDPKMYSQFRRNVEHVDNFGGLTSLAVRLAFHRGNGAGRTQDVREILDEHASNVRSRYCGSQQQAVLAHLHEYLFDELGFGGETADYNDACSSYLPSVLETRQGLPIAICLIYKSIATRLGQAVHGVGLPGHFLVKVETDTGMMLVDCFAKGRVLSDDEARDRVLSIFGPEVEWSESMLAPVSHRMWISRMIQNLLHLFTTQEQWTDVGAMLELQMLLWPEQVQLQRDLGLVLARVNMPDPASMWLSRYISSNPNDPERAELAELVSRLKV